MGVDIHVAVHAADWPTPAILNRCMTERRLPVQITGLNAGEMNAPLARTPAGSIVVKLDGKDVDIEASVTQLAPGRSYAYTMPIPPGVPSRAPGQAGAGSPDVSFVILGNPQPGSSDGGVATRMTPEEFKATLRPADINADLKAVGVTDVAFGNGDFVLTVTIRGGGERSRAGYLLLAGIVYCAEGVGFIPDMGVGGKERFGTELEAAAADAASR